MLFLPRLVWAFILSAWIALLATRDSTEWSSERLGPYGITVTVLLGIDLAINLLTVHRRPLEDETTSAAPIPDGNDTIVLTAISLPRERWKACAEEMNSTLRWANASVAIPAIAIWLCFFILTPGATTTRPEVLLGMALLVIAVAMPFALRARRLALTRGKLLQSRDLTQDLARQLDIGFDVHDLSSLVRVRYVDVGQWRVAATVRSDFVHIAKVAAPPPAISSTWWTSFWRH